MRSAECRRSLQVIAPASLQVRAGEPVGLLFDATKLHLFDPAAGGRLG